MWANIRFFLLRYRLSPGKSLNFDSPRNVFAHALNYLFAFYLIHLNVNELLIIKKNVLSLHPPFQRGNGNKKRY
jgi:hypothetical protein